MGKKKKIWNNVLYLVLNIEKLDAVLRFDGKQEQPRVHLSTLFVQESEAEHSCNPTGNIAQKTAKNPVTSPESVVAVAKTNTDTTTYITRPQSQTNTTNHQTVGSVGGGCSDAKELKKESSNQNALKEKEQGQEQENDQDIPEEERELFNHMVKHIKSVKPSIPDEDAIDLYKRMKKSFRGMKILRPDFAMIANFVLVMGYRHDEFDRIVTDKDGTRRGIQELWINPIRQWVKDGVTIEHLRLAKKVGLADGYHDRNLSPHSYEGKVYQAKNSPNSCYVAIRKAQDACPDSSDNNTWMKESIYNDTWKKK